MMRKYLAILALLFGIAPAFAQFNGCPPGFCSPKQTAAPYSTLLNMRGTAGYVTDSPGQTYVINDSYPTTRNGVTFGWSGASNATDRSTANGPRFAGINYVTPNQTATLEIDLPAPGTYKVNYAVGDPGGFSQSTTVTILDNTTTLNTSGTLATTTNAYDINGTSYASYAAYTAGTTPISLTFTTTKMILSLHGTSSGAGVLMNVSVTQ